MIESELAEIEGRIHRYSPQAQEDIRWLARELRKAHNLGTRLADPPAAAIHDAGTGLLSGGAYGVRFAMARARADRYRRMFGAMSIELHPGSLDGDTAARLVREVAGRLAGIARSTDTLARVDHLKFAMILEELNVPGDAERVKQKVEAALAPPVVIGECGVIPAARVTLAFFPAKSRDGAAH